jgi:hypothetical protein
MGYDRHRETQDCLRQATDAHCELETSLICCLKCQLKPVHQALLLIDVVFEGLNFSCHSTVQGLVTRNVSSSRATHTWALLHLVLNSMFTFEAEVSSPIQESHGIASPSSEALSRRWQTRPSSYWLSTKVIMEVNVAKVLPYRCRQLWESNSVYNVPLLTNHCDGVSNYNTCVSNC